jgi:hypothetical protein
MPRRLPRRAIPLARRWPRTGPVAPMAHPARRPMKHYFR